MRGVKKGAMTVEQADTLWQQWIDAKEGKISSRRAQTAADLEAFRKLVSGEAKKVKAPVADETAHEAAEAFKVTENVVEAPAVEEVAPAAEEVAPVAEEVVEAAPAVEEVAPVVEEKVATEEAAPAVEEEVVAAAEEAAPEVATEEASEETKTEKEA